MRSRTQQLRESKAWSQSELARQSGVPQTTISRLEAGKIGVVSLAHLEKPATAFGVNAAVLIEHTPGGKGKPR